MSDGWTLLGEVDKFIAMSRTRVTSVDVGSGSTPTAVHVSGSPSSVVRLAALAPGSSEVIVLSATVTADGTATIELKPPSSSSSSSPRTPMQESSLKEKRHTTPMSNQQVTHPAAAALLRASATPTPAANYTETMLPLPQQLMTDPTPPLSVGPDWIIAADLTDARSTFAANDLATALASITGGVYSVLPFRAVTSGQNGRFIILGTAGATARHCTRTPLHTHNNYNNNSSSNINNDNDKCLLAACSIHSFARVHRLIHLQLSVRMRTPCMCMCSPYMCVCSQ